MLIQCSWVQILAGLLCIIHSQTNSIEITYLSQVSLAGKTLLFSPRLFLGWIPKEVWQCGAKPCRETRRTAARQERPSSWRNKSLWRTAWCCLRLIRASYLWSISGGISSAVQPGLPQYTRLWCLPHSNQHTGQLSQHKRPWRSWVSMLPCGFLKFAGVPEIKCKLNE